jgi:hypothetical protein
MTADDGNTGQTSFSLSLTVTQNHAPMIIGLFSDTTLIPFSNPLVVDLSKYTYDLEDDPILFSLQLDKEDIIIADINGSMLTIDPRHHGLVTLRITASDSYNAKTTEIIRITVEQKYLPEKTNRLLVYPNPATDILWYSYILTHAATVDIRIVNSIGQIMYQTPTEKRLAGTYYENINCHTWNIGMYVVQFFINGKMIDINKVMRY